jgi:integrase
MDKYRPQLAPARWAPIRNFILELVTELHPPTPKYATDVCSFLARHVDWALTTAGLTLDREDMFHPALMHRSATETYTSPKTRQLMEARLLKIAEAIGEGGRVHRLKVNVNDIQPYDRTGLTHVSSWVASQADPTKRRYGYAMLGFCMGAGLRVAELADLRAGDVTLTSNGYVVTVQGDYARSLPVHPDWMTSVDKALEDVQDDEYVIDGETFERRRHVVSHFGRRRMGSGAGRVFIGAERLRVTWVIQMLDALPLATLVHVAGYKNPSSLVRYMGHSTVMPEDELFAAMRQTVVTR